MTRRSETAPASSFELELGKLLKLEGPGVSEGVGGEGQFPPFGLPLVTENTLAILQINHVAKRKHIKSFYNLIAQHQLHLFDYLPVYTQDP